MCTYDVVLSFDQSTVKTGYALHVGEKLLISGVVAFPKRYSRRQKFVLLQETIATLTAIEKPTIVVIEDVKGGRDGLYTLQALSQLTAVIVLATACEVVSIATATWRKEVLGHGHATKERAVAFVKERYGLEVEHDQAEAVCIGRSWLCITEKSKFRLVS